jgi:hypothetical protein
MRNRTYYIGVDLGKSHDHTAIVIVERVEADVYNLQREVLRLDLRYAERVALGTPYTVVTERIRRIVADLNRWGQCELVVDASGVGEPVMDMLRGSSMGCSVIAVKITGGEKATRSGNEWHVPKGDLIAAVRELLDMQATLGGNGRVRMGADGYGQHDDLVIALALACWKGRMTKKWSAAIPWG